MSARTARWALALAWCLGAASAGTFSLLLWWNEALASAWALLPWGLFVGGALWLRASSRRGRALWDAPPPLSSAHVGALERDVGYYRALSPDGQARFRREVARFLARHRIRAVGLDATPTLETYVAASAVMLTFGWGSYAFSTLREIVLCPSAFRDGSHGGLQGELLGIFSDQGPLVFSAEDLEAAFCEPGAQVHVGVHEFAHWLDAEGDGLDGVPWQAGEAADAWRAEARRLLKSHLLRMRVRRWLGPHAVEDETELFAHLVEAFFLMPRILRARFPQTYARLSALLAQDPASLLEEGAALEVEGEAVGLADEEAGGEVPDDALRVATDEQLDEA